MRSLAVLWGLALSLSMGTAVPVTAGDVDYGRIRSDVTVRHARPGYDTLAAKGAGLRAAAGKLCPGPDQRAFDAMRRAFHDVDDAWQAVEHLRFGPAAKIDAHARLNFWPDRRGRVGKHLSRLLARKDAAILQPGAFAGGSIAVQGLPALERLLFAEDALGKLRSEAGAVTPCRAVAAIAANVAAVTADLAAGWRRDAQAAKPPKEGTSDAFNSLAGGLGAVADLKLAGPLGGKSGRVRPKRAEHWRSARALKNVALNLTALGALYGRLADAAGPVLAGSPSDKLIRQQFKNAIADTKALGPSFLAAAKTEAGQLRLKALAADIRDLRELVVVNMAEALDLAVGFNSFDGD